jgi:hypothetical protein
MLPDRANRCHDFQAQLAAYALGEAEADSETLGHLAGCAECRRTLATYTHIARTLPYTASQVTPAPELRARILAAARATPAELPRSRQQVLAPRRRVSRALSWGVVCAALLALLGWNITLQMRLNSQTAQLTRLTTQVAASRENWRTMTDVLNRSDLHAYQLSGNQATGHFWASPQSSVACLVVEDLPDPGADKVYQVWLEQSGTPVGAGTFVTNAGSGWILVRSDQPWAVYQSVDVTIEPRGGSQTPTGQEVLRGRLALTAQARNLDQAETIRFMPYQP